MQSQNVFVLLVAIAMVVSLNGCAGVMICFACGVRTETNLSVCLIVSSAFTLSSMRVWASWSDGSVCDGPRQGDHPAPRLDGWGLTAVSLCISKQLFSCPVCKLIGRGIYYLPLITLQPIGTRPSASGRICTCVQQLIGYRH